jgi:hypothetical protein
MSDLLRFIIDIKNGEQSPLNPMRVYRMSDKTARKTQIICGVQSFAEIGIDLQFDNSLAENEVYQVASVGREET